MQHDFIHPRQLDDMQAIRAAIKAFSGDMTKMMLLMKELGTTLERVSHSFDALTSLSFSADGVKQYVHHFAEEVILMKEGVAFRNYNKLVHEEVLLPVEELKASLKAAERSAKTEKNAFDKYKKAKARVDKQEKSFAEKSRPLDTSKSYPNHVHARDSSLVALQRSKDDFEGKFVSLVKEVEKVTATALKRYLKLNAGYMASVIDALTKTDPTVEEAVALYRREQAQLRQSTIKKRCTQVNSEFDASYASQGYHMDPNSSVTAPSPTSFREHVQQPGTMAASGRRPPLSNTSTPESTPLKPSTNGAPRGPPPASAKPQANKPAAAAATPVAVAATTPTTAAAVSASSSSSPPRSAATSSPATLPPPQYGGAPTNTVAAPAAAAPLRNDSLASRPAADDVDDEDFGSVSQVGTAGRVAPPLYNFSRGPLSQVSSVRPQSGYVAAANAALTNEFMTRMETRSLTASEVGAPRQVQR